MEDFATFCKTEKHNKAIELQNSVKEQTGFIASRLNRDNFWNLIFLTLTSLIIFIAQQIMNAIPAGFLLLFTAIILSPYFVARLNPIQYVDNVFISSSTNRKLGKYAPKYLGFLIWCGIPFSVFWILLLHSRAPYLDENMALYNAIFWFVPTMYFILRNLPISMIFNKNAWKQEKHEGASYTSCSRNNSKPLLGADRMLTDPMNKSFSGNIYHRR
jgi:hypothetical protein